jgi:organic radical activating enzyme
MNNIPRIKKIIPITDAVSPTFCLAKWYHANIYLQLGLTHSCYHPRPHAIPLDTNVPSSLHNTPQKKSERLSMLAGEKPDGCHYCWNIEALGPDHYSERMERNSSIYRDGLIEETIKDPMGNVNPEYIEISFGNECNFKCGYCHPKYSTAYYKEIKDFGPYTTVKNHRNDIDYFTIYEEETNPYVKLWWEWWPEVSKTLNVLRVTGGEPLLQQSTWRLFDELEKNPLPNLELNINSNLGVKPILVERLCDKVNSLLKNGKIKRFKLFTSIDTWGAPAEYIRTGLDLTVWEKNLDTYLTRTNTAIDFMITFNVLTVTNFKSLLEKILQWRKKYNGWVQTEWQRVRFDIAYLVQPLQYDINILPKEEFMPFMHQSLEYMRKHQRGFKRNTFMQLETEKFANIVKYMESTSYPENKIKEGRKDFYNWFAEYDRRRGTNFVETFPELINFYQQCAKVEI